MAEQNHSVLKNRSEIFFAGGLDSGISLASPCEHSFFRACDFFRRPPRIGGQTRQFADGSLPDGQINAANERRQSRRVVGLRRWHGLRLIAAVRHGLGSEKARAEVDPIAQQHEREQQAGAAEDDDGAERFDIDLETGRARKHSGKGGHCSLQQNPENSV
jgi:hypothetical protein